MNQHADIEKTIKSYYTFLDTLKIHCVKEHILSFLTGFDDTVDKQISKCVEKQKKDCNDLSDYLRNFNVCRILAGMPGIGYSN